MQQRSALGQSCCPVRCLKWCSGVIVGVTGALADEVIYAKAVSLGVAGGAK